METVRALLIHIGIPIAGFLAYVGLCRRIAVKEIPSPPYIEYFVIFFTFGGWIMIFVTLRFWYWSGMATIGFFFLLTAMPLFFIGLALSLFRNRNVSKYHLVALVCSCVYLAFIIVSWTILVLYNR